jgi:oligopeptide/dipeptide ABC transporter ATP-binding protein
MVFQNPLSSLNPISRRPEALRFHGIVPDVEVPAEIERLLRVMPARRPRPRPQRAPVHAGAGRTGRGTRRLDPGAGAEPARGSTPRTWSHHAVRRPRAFRSPPHVASRRRHVSGRDRRHRHQRRDFRRARPSLYAKLCALPCPGWARASVAVRPCQRATSPNPYAIPPGCRFQTRCPKAQDICRRMAPPSVQLSPMHKLDCHFPELTNFVAGSSRRAGPEFEVSFRHRSRTRPDRDVANLTGCAPMKLALPWPPLSARRHTALAAASAVTDDQPIRLDSGSTATPAAIGLWSNSDEPIASAIEA